MVTCDKLRVLLRVNSKFAILVQISENVSIMLNFSVFHYFGKLTMNEGFCAVRQKKWNHTSIKTFEQDLHPQNHHLTENLPLTCSLPVPVSCFPPVPSPFGCSFVTAGTMFCSFRGSFFGLCSWLEPQPGQKRNPGCKRVSPQFEHFIV